ncbi:Protein numb [Schistosoma japonicum]|nr:Protein numb [Schistosoma japonicum]KAH8861363.1 Protein numb [Schistosoma japonicum]KAH8861364.1 Protein numb [Schistosoma japonicum]KAH8861366.1 Protein numb [Schistosoma japonicum]KAH8861367.1 Protein numb [Schistosoma japonicum]
MNRLRRTFSFRKRKKQNRSEAGDSSKPQQWLDDEVKIKEGFCSFQVKYLGNIEVYESRGMQVCEEAIKALRKSKKKPQKAVLSVSGDALRVSDDVSQHLIVDQTIEKVSFCAPDRNHEKGFAYICRDGATRRWMCHAFLAVKESGERLSHAVGCAFAICLEKKQRRERDALQLEASDDRPIFTRVGSFRPATLAERLLDPQSTITADPVPQSHNSSPTSSTIMNRVASPVSHVGAIPRPHASPSIIERQGSLRIFPKLQENSPFKRDLSLRLEGVPSNLRRLTGMIQGAPIAEEPDTDFEPIKPGVFSKTDEQRGKIESVTTSSTHNWSQFKVASSSFNFPVLNGSPAAAQFTSGHYFDSRTSQAVIPPIIADPFSAAPVNPATIQQHHQIELQQYQTAQQQQQQHSQPIMGSSLLNSKAQTTASVITSTPTSPFLGGPPIAAPSVSTTFNPNSWVVTYPQTQQFNRSTIQHNVISSNSHITGTMNSASNLGHPTNGVLKSIPIVSSGSTNNPWSMGLNDTNNGTWQTSPALSPPLLPPEPDCLSDPFDLGWVDRATAVVPTSIVGGRDIMSNPFLITNGDGSNILQQNTSMHN